jgi:beta-galactosidase
VRNEREPGRDEQGRWVYRAGPELKSREVRIEPEAENDFCTWLQRRYGTLEHLKEAWNAGHAGLSGHDWETWEQAVAQVRPGVNDRGYNRLKDVIRFKSEVFLRQVQERVDAELAHDSDAPVRAGGEISVFLPVTGRGVDMEGVARLMADRGSLYPSTHPAWHFDKVNYELTRTVYMYSSLMADVFKGGWTATWESTGGPQQISGDKGWSPEAQHLLPAYTVDAGVMTQMILTYLAAGYRGLGFWCWTARTAGREGGEYSLLDRNNQPGERAVCVGRIGQAARRLRDELWRARKEPLVGVLVDRENDIQWAVMADFGRDLFAEMPVQARVGVGRALINANVPWEHVTADDLRRGLAGRYKAIYLPAMLALSGDVFEILAEYVARGGRLVMDMPSAYFDERARITDTGRGSAFEELFGCTINDFQYASNVPRSLEGMPLAGFVVDMTVTGARALATYDNGRPAVTECTVSADGGGAGSALVLGYEASLMCARPGNEDAERRLVRYALGGYRPPYACEGAIVYRLAAPQADHYFLINDGPARSVCLDYGNYRYVSVGDPVAQCELDLGAPIPLEAYDGRWLRYVKEGCDG